MFCNGPISVKCTLHFQYWLFAFCFFLDQFYQEAGGLLLLVFKNQHLKIYVLIILNYGYIHYYSVLDSDIQQSG